jgi:Bacterial Ig domain
MTVSPHSVVRGNFNTDTQQDLAFATGLPDTLHVLLNNTLACGLPSTAGVAICSPKAGSAVTSPIKVAASANGGSRKITTMKAYIDGKLVASSATNTLNASVAKAVGTHKLTVNAWDSIGKLYQSIISFNVH